MMNLAPEDLTRLRTVKDGSYFMRRGVTADWIRRMTNLGMVRRRRACERNGWTEDLVLTRNGEEATRTA